MGNTTKNLKLFYYNFDNNKMETQITLKGYLNDKIFIKHIGISELNIKLEQYSSTWIESKNTVNIIKPIKNSEPFRITVLISNKDHFKDYSLCAFVETPFDKYNTLGDYVYTFVSNSSDVVSHYIDFTNIKDYNIGKEFDLLVYAVQLNKTKLEVLYSIIQGKVGNIDGIEEINGKILNKDNYATRLFLKNITSNNYLYYNFDNKPLGDIASLKIFPASNKEEETPISKISCTFVSKEASNEEMISAVNEAERTFNNICKGDTLQDSNGFNALINTKNIEKGFTKLVILIKYKKENNKEKIYDNNMMNITIRTTGYKIDKEDYGYNEDERLTLIPYVIDLKEIRQMQKENYYSKVLIYSMTRELDIYYIQDNTTIQLFSGNIMLLYTNEDVIKEKYNGASTMILLTDSLSIKKPIPFGEKFRFKIYFFTSDKNIQYYVSANPQGRPINNPTSIEMLDCEQPYYYILNYHKTEGDRMLHIDTIFGEINSTKFADKLTADSWDTFISQMTAFKGDEYIIRGQNDFHIDVFEVKCNTPLLLNIYYTDEANPKRTNLQQGDISILTLKPNKNDNLSFIENLNSKIFLYSFTVHRNYGEPNIYIEFNNKDKDNKDNMIINKNGIYIKNTPENYKTIKIYNKQLTGDDSTKLYFKFGINLDESFTKIENDIYNIQTEDRIDNIFAYIFKNGEDRLNYTKINFIISTTYDNVKFCYSTNFGVLITTSTQNCFRVGKNNNYTITVINPYIMYKNYLIENENNEIMNYFATFKTENKDLNITILPELIKYNTNNRNYPDISKTLIINKENKTILTNPNNKEYIFIQMEMCSLLSGVRYEFKNAFNQKSLGEKGEIRSDMKYKYKNIKNIKLDTELIINTDNKDVNMFIKHTGLTEEFYPNIKKISIEYKNNKLIFNQPIINEEFKYTLLLDIKNYIKNRKYTLCSFNQNQKMAYYTDYIISSNKEITYELDFENNPLLKGYKNFEVLILAEEINNGKMMILSDVYSPNENKSSENETRITLIIIIAVLSVVCVVGGIGVFFYVRKIKSNRNKYIAIAKHTDIDDIDGTNTGDKLVESMSQSQAVEE